MLNAKDRSKMAKGNLEKVVVIKLRNLGDDFQLQNNPNFIKIIENEYASKYLEIL
jgi:hypothetical protein